MSGDETQPSDGGSPEAFCSACSQSYEPTMQFCPKDGARLVRFAGGADPLIGRVIEERFEVQARIGRGGMGSVYRAWQRSVDREVAIKVIDARLSNDRVAAKRFLREARLASRLSHPAIVVVYDFGQTDDGVLYLVMEMLRGRTLAAEIAARPLTTRRMLRIALQLCDALEAAHRQDIVHRDLKPQNVVILDEPPGRDLVKVLDFGLAKSLVHDESAVTRSDAIIGTPLYMAPESIQGKAADARTDLYSLGCILHELASGAAPFRDESPNMVLAKHLSEPPPALSAKVPEPLRLLISELLAKEPADRPASATVVRDRLQAMTDGGGAALDQSSATTTVAPAAFADTMASPRGTQDQTRDAATREVPTSVAFMPPAPAPRRARWPWLLAAGVVLAGVGGVLVVRMSGGDPTPTPTPAPAVITLDAATVPAVVAPDAAVEVAVPVDAGSAPPRPIDAGRRDRPPIDARPRPIDAGAAVAVPIDARAPPIDAKPDVDFILPKDKP